MADKTEKGKGKAPHCPYCDKEVSKEIFPFCSACQVTITYCSSCGKPVPRGKDACPSCKTRVKG